MRLRTDQKVMCEIQGKLFELALDKGYDSPRFIELFMNSRVAADLDLTYNKYQWMGEEYLIEELYDEVGDIPSAGKTYNKEILYWCGYIYRYWHYYTGEESKEIYAIADAETMSMCWPAYHTLDVEFAIDRLKETTIDEHRKNELREKIYNFLENNPDSNYDEIAKGVGDMSIQLYKIIGELEDEQIIRLSSPVQRLDEGVSARYRVVKRRIQ